MPATHTSKAQPEQVGAREQQIGGSWGSLEPPGPLIEPPGLLLTHLHTVYMAYSERLPTRLNPLAERTYFSQVGAADFLRSRPLPWQSAQGSDDDDGAPLELPRRLPERKTGEIHSTVGRGTTNEREIRTSADVLPRGQFSRADLLGWWAANGERVMTRAATGSPSAIEPHHLGRREPSSRGSCGL
jgi:hypothetical protein